MKTRQLAVCVVFVVACTNDYDAFHFNGGASAGGSGGEAATAGAGGAGTAGDAPEGGGGSEPGNALPCGGAECGPNQICCISENGETNGECKDHCGGHDASLRCNDPSDCPGAQCCLDLMGAKYEEAHCAPSCNDLTLCDPDDPDCDGNACNPIDDLPPGYAACDEG